MAGKYAQSPIDEILEVVAIATPLRSRVAPKPPPPVSKVLPSRVMLVVLMDERKAIPAEIVSALKDPAIPILLKFAAPPRMSLTFVEGKAKL
jgi:hypothetical protein